MMKMKVLHIVGGSIKNGAFKGAAILHKGLLKENIDSKILNDSNLKIQNIQLEQDKKIVSIKERLLLNILNKIYVTIEKILKFIFLHSPRETFSISILGFDITKFKEYQEADIIHIHWLGQGFINLNSLSKIDKPVVWTMRDMWPFSGGPHYTMDFEKYEKSRISQLIKNYKKKNYKKNFIFVAVSKWLKKEAERSSVLKNYNIIQIDNNIDTSNFEELDKETARSILNINTKKKVILYGAQNPQSKRKGWNIFTDTLKKIDKSKYFLLIFGNFWSNKLLQDIGIEYKSLGYINDNKILNAVYNSSDFFIASSIQDAWPKIFAEAMYCKVPVICFKNTSVSEIVEHKTNGFIIDEYNTDLFKEAIDWISTQLDKNNNLGENAKEKVKRYDSEIIASKYFELYKKIYKTNTS